MCTTQAFAFLTLVATVSIASAQQKASNTVPRVTDVERQAAANAAASQGSSIDAMNAKMPQDRSEPAFGTEFANTVRAETERLERRMIDIDESFERGLWRLPPTQPSSARTPEPAPVPERGDVKRCPEHSEPRVCSVQPGGVLGRKKAPKTGEAPRQEEL